MGVFVACFLFFFYFLFIAYQPTYLMNTNISVISASFADALFAYLRLCMLNYAAHLSG